MVVFGLVMTFVGSEPPGVPGWLPSMQQTWHGVQTGLLAVVGSLVCWIFLSVWLRRYLPEHSVFQSADPDRNQRHRRVRCRRRKTNGAQDAWPFVGTVGEAVSELKPGGTGRFPFGDDVRATSVVSASGFVPQGTESSVQEMRGTRVVRRQA